MTLTLTVLLLSLASASYAAIPFIYTDENPRDPANVALLQQALMHVGINPDGLRILTVQSNYQGFRTSYKMTYIAKDGNQCFLHWRVDALFGPLSPEMPVCENKALGIGDSYLTRFPAVHQTITYTPTEPPGLRLSAYAPSTSNKHITPSVTYNISAPSIGHETTQITTPAIYCTKPPCPAPPPGPQIPGGSSKNPHSAPSNKLSPYEKYLKKSL